MVETYYVRIRGRVSGPYGLDQLKDMRNRGRLMAIHEISMDKASWRPARELDEVFGRPSSSSGQGAFAGNSEQGCSGIELLPDDGATAVLNEEGLIPFSELASTEAEPPITPKADATPPASHDEEHISDNRFLKFIIGGAGVVLALFAITMLTLHFVSSAKATRQLAELTAVVDQAIGQANHHSGDFQYEKARAVLKEAEQTVAQSPLSSAYVQERRLQNEVEKLDAAEKDYENKIAKGYEQFEGRFVSPQEKSQLLVERQRQEEERRRQEEEQHRAEERRLAEERQREAEELKIAAYLMSQEFIKKPLKAPSTARFPKYSDSAVIVTFDAKDGNYTVMAWVEAQNAFGVHLRKNYMCVLYPAGGNLWRSSLATLLEE